MNIKLRFILLAFLGNSLTGFSQEYKFIYYLDANFSPCDQSKASVIGKGNLENGYLKLDCFNKSTDKLFFSAFFKDSTLNVMHGSFHTYYQDMKVESEGNYTQNVMQGIWQNWDKKGNKTDSLIYESGVKIFYGKYTYHNKNTLRSCSFTDTINDFFSKQNFSESGKIENEVKFIGNRGLLKIFDGSGIKMDSVFTREEIEAEFPGGDAVWVAIIAKNIRSWELVNVKNQKDFYIVYVTFVVGDDGTIGEVKAESMGEQGAELEAVRVIKNSPKWRPAKLYGKNVKSYIRQPITFVAQ